MIFQVLLLVIALMVGGIAVAGTPNQQRFVKRTSRRMVTRIFGKAQDLVTKAVFGKESVTMKELFYDCIDKDMSGKDVKMETFKGHVLLAVNVASKWGLTKQNYTELRQLLDTYKDKPFKVLGFPCNQFGGQEPGTHEEILSFVDKFGLKDDIVWFEKADVNGANTREVYSLLKKKLPSDDGTADIRWNFAKFLIDSKGIPTKRYAPTTAPLDIKDDIDKLLSEVDSK